MGWQGDPGAMNKDESGGWVCLHPFDHQVGGHTGVVLLDEDTICKPLVPKEYWTYKTMSPALRKFVPELKGWTNVHIRKDKDGNVSLFTSRPNGSNGTSVSLPCEDCRGGSQNGFSDSNGDTGGIVAVTTNGNKKTLCAFHRSPSKVDYENYEIADNICEAVSNPWSLRCWKRQLWTFEQSGVTQNCKYILLENLASKYEHPSILDLKIGIRGYGDDVTEEKRLAHMAKARLSTAGTLGVRIGGMQVYQVGKDSYRRFTKHYGKTISDYNTLLATIREYFHDGLSIRRDVLAEFILRLKSLMNVIDREEGCRFFGCSLLVLYEGGPPSPLGDTAKEEVSTDMNRGNADSPGMCPPASEVTPLSNDIPNIHRTNGLEDMHVEADGRTNCGSKSSTDSTHLSPVRGDLILRVIDFPHVEYQNGGTPRTVHDGPDENFLFGLNNLLEILERIQSSL